MEDCFIGIAAIAFVLWMLVALANAHGSRTSARLAENLAAQERILRETLAQLKQQMQAFLQRNPHYTTALHQIASRSIYRDEFGDLSQKEWHKSLRKFAAEKLEIASPIPAKDYPQEYIDALDDVLRSLWKRAGLPQPSERTGGASAVLKRGVTEGTDFEHQCADVFRSAGYATQRIGASADQGADLIARKKGRVLIVQCKSYSGAVSNAAVQQAAAAKGFYDAQEALVVTDYGRFTRSARQLAQKLDVALVTFHSLADHLQKGRSGK